MLNINKEVKGTTLIVTLEGRLDTNAAPELDKVLRTALDGKTELIMDFAKVEYVASAGLRSLLIAQKTMKTKGTMVLKNVSNAVKDIFEVSGFLNILTIE